MATKLTIGEFYASSQNSMFLFKVTGLRKVGRSNVVELSSYNLDRSYPTGGTLKHEIPAATAKRILRPAPATTTATQASAL